MKKLSVFAFFVLCASGASAQVSIDVVAMVATLPTGWSDLFTYDTETAGAQPVPLVRLNAQGLRRKCADETIGLHVLGTNASGQMHCKRACSLRQASSIRKSAA